MKDQDRTKPEPHIASRAEEAKHLVEEALEAKREGNRDEANFLMQAADDLDMQTTNAARREAKTGGKT